MSEDFVSAFADGRKELVDEQFNLSNDTASAIDRGSRSSARVSEQARQRETEAILDTLNPLGQFTDLSYPPGPVETLESCGVREFGNRSEAFGVSASRLRVLSEYLVSPSASNRQQTQQSLLTGVQTLVASFPCEANARTRPSHDPGDMGRIAVALSDLLKLERLYDNVEADRVAKALLNSVNPVWTMWQGLGNTPVQRTTHQDRGFDVYTTFYESGPIELVPNFTVDFGRPATVRLDDFSPHAHLIADALNAGPVLSPSASEAPILDQYQDVSGWSDNQELKVGTGSNSYLRFDTSNVPQDFSSAELEIHAPNNNQAASVRLVPEAVTGGVVTNGWPTVDGATGVPEGPSVGDLQSVGGNRYTLDVSDELRRRVVIGDINRDGHRSASHSFSDGVYTDFHDVAAFEQLVRNAPNEALSEEDLLRADINRSGTVDCLDFFDTCTSGTAGEVDLPYGVLEILGYYPGDVNFDGLLDSSDLVIINLYGATDGRPAVYATGDLNLDGEYETGDLIALFAYGAYNTGVAAQPIDNTISFNLYGQTTATFQSSEAGNPDPPRINFEYPLDVSIDSFAVLDAGTAMPTQLQVRYHVDFAYEIANQSTAGFTIGIYRSSDGVSLDERLMSIPVSSASDGFSVQAFAPDFSGHIDEDYQLVAVVDDDTSLPDVDRSNNTAVFSGGVFQETLVSPAGRRIYIHGTSDSDTVAVSSGQITFNSNTLTLSPSLGTSDTVYGFGHAGGDQIETTGNLVSPQFLFGGRDDDVLIGGRGSDWLDGGPGADEIRSLNTDATANELNGNDTMIGGLGSDTFHVGASRERGVKTIVEVPTEGGDTIDFSAASGELSIDLSSTEPKTLFTGLQMQLVDGLDGSPVGPASIERLLPMFPPSLEFLAERTAISGVPVDFQFMPSPPMRTG